jgi:hypothetical protein
VQAQNMSHTHPFGTALFLEYSTKLLEKIFKNHHNILNIIWISLALKICQNMSFQKKFKLLNMSF